MSNPWRVDLRSKGTDWLIRIMQPGGAKCLTRGGLILVIYLALNNNLQHK
jgi:hypothetical protein